MIERLHRLLSVIAPPSYPLAICAHRGYSANAPENTLAAFREAISVGVELIECDVARTLDDELLVIHDRKVNRTTDGRGLLRDMLWREVRSLDAGSWFTEDYSGERVPKLEEALELVRDQCILLIELKEKFVAADPIETPILRLVRDFGMLEQVVILCRSDESVRHIKSVEPEAHVAFITIRRKTAWRVAAELPICGLLPYYRSLNRATMAHLHANDCFIIPWNVNREKEMRTLIGWGADGIITDCPHVCRELREKLEHDLTQELLTEPGEWEPRMPFMDDSRRWPL